MNNCHLQLYSYKYIKRQELTYSIKNLLLQNYDISVALVKNSYQILFYFFQFIMKQNVYQLSCTCQHTQVEDKEFLRFQMISVKHLNEKKNKLNHCLQQFVTHIHCKIQMICLINLQKLITVWVSTVFLKSKIYQKNNLARYHYLKQQINID